jgi:radical SAM protein with 4Fe4S-binding SPASM domain
MGIMPFELFRKIIDECTLHGPRAFALCKDGEPFINPRFLDMVSYIKEKNPRNVIAITTNGLLLDERKSRELLKRGVDKLTFSIRAASAEVYYEVCKSREYEKAESNVREFLRLKAEGGYEKPYVFLQFLPLEEASPERDDFVRRWQGYDVTLDMSGLFSWGGAVDGQQFNHADFNRRYPCYELWFTPAINWNGEVSVCSYDWNRDLIVGDLNHESLADIWHGERMEQYRCLHREGKAHTLPTCDRCEIWAEYPDIFFWWQKKRN